MKPQISKKIRKYMKLGPMDWWAITVRKNPLRTMFVCYCDKCKRFITSKVYGEHKCPG